ncbi:site-specific DNA-methyltransferase [Ramlibacter sp. USB13]|uniref:site-specific DNA-methyltransferase (adenine-specific) n=1 Tax=Ramlibacter cellulosilyticus TaxID=2764187 RepID=A0A923MPU6_9BURK|nr:site-specific DNA-methyltransferase [Ramlibacter cellulosilyticus]MBC5782656.1 site-specific DNA-methyltransferase [Ramlibacter cellulosilyticus]
MATRKSNGGAAAKTVETIRHDEARRKNIPTAEYQSVLEKQKLAPVEVKYPRSGGQALEEEKQARNSDLDPQLVWRGKDRQDWSDLVVHAAPLYIQEKVHAKALVDDLLRETRERQHVEGERTPDLFSDFNGVPHDADKTEFYAHDQNWSNRMILGDSLQVMASLAEREGLRGKVQCIYFDPPYGIKFNSNFQWSTTSRDVKDGNAGHITREPEQVKAFRDTWRDGIHSYLTYLRDRLAVARDLLTESGSIFLQIGDENVHRVRAVLDEVFGDANHVATISFQKTGSSDEALLPQTVDYLLFYARDKTRVKFRPLYVERQTGSPGLDRYDLAMDQGGLVRRFAARDESDPAIERGRYTAVVSARPAGEGDLKSFAFQGRTFRPGTGTFKTNESGLKRLERAARLFAPAGTLQYLRKISDFRVLPIADRWESIQIGTGLLYVVQTSAKAIERCLLMATDPGDLVLDPTCGSGTTAYVAEQWARRWITVDTSRVALALARTRIMGARYPYYIPADTREGQIKEAEITGSAPSVAPVHGRIRQGFVYERVPRIKLSSITNNAEVDVIWDEWQKALEPLREQLNSALKRAWAEWEIPREADAKWPDTVRKLHAQWWQARIARQKAIDASIAANAEYQYLYDKPYEDKKRVRVAGPFTVESLSPHRVLGVDENDELIDPLEANEPDAGFTPKPTFAQIILENLKTAGVQQAHKEGRINFTSLTPWPGELVCAEGRYVEGDAETGKPRRAAILIGPEFGTVTRVDLVAAARESADAGFDVLIACAFNYEAHTTEFNKLGALPVLKARMNADLHMAEDLKNTGKGNLFVIFGEPDIDLLAEPDGRLRVKVKGVDVFRPNEGKVESSGPDEIACWFVDTDYNEESFFVRQAYFLGASDPYKSLKTTLKAEIDEEAWATLYGDTSRPFPKPKSGRIAVKVINHLGDEVMKVFRVA